MSEIDEIRRTSFDRKAEQYDAVRPSYPESLIDAALARTGAHRLLEVGAGTGKATLLFARRGCSILAIEPSPNMAAVLRRHAAALPNITIEETTFEAWPGADGSFELAFASQAIHWIDPAVRYTKLASSLRPGGSLAILRNEHQSVDPELRAEWDLAYARWFPTEDTSQWPIERARDLVVDEIDASGCFGPVHVELVPWTASYTSREYRDLLDTYSNHAVLPDAQRLPLYEAITAAIDRRGGRLELPYSSMLCLAQRRD